jgi:hypothetical protein
LAGALDDILAEKVGERIGFCLLVFPFGEKPEGADAGADYVANARRSNMIKFLKETADRLENREDIGPTQGTA